MFTDRNSHIEFEYKGTFYRIDDYKSPDGDLIDSNQNEEETVILETMCDIQETRKAFATDVIKKEYTVYFPFKADDGLPPALKPGIYFRSEMYGMAVDGMVTGVYPTQMGGCTAYVTGSDV